MNDEDEEDLDRLPLDDQDPLHRVVRMRRGLRERRDENAQRVLDVTDRFYGAQVRAANAATPQEQLLALVQALAHATEGFVLTVSDAYRVVDRIASELRSICEHTARLQTAADQLEKLGLLARERLTAADKDWSGVADAVATRASDSITRSIAGVGVKQRRVARLALWIGGFVVLMTSLPGYFAWRTYAALDSLHLPALSSPARLPIKLYGLRQAANAMPSARPPPPCTPAFKKRPSTSPEGLRLRGLAPGRVPVPSPPG